MLSGIYLCIVFFSQAISGIPLPGEEGVYDNESDDFHGTYSLGFLAAVPAVVSRPNIHGGNSFTYDNIQHDVSDHPTTESPLEKLLDSLYGNSSWRVLLNESRDQAEIPTTSLPGLELTTKKLSGMRGFYSMQISGNIFDHTAVGGDNKEEHFNSDLKHNQSHNPHNTVPHIAAATRLHKTLFETAGSQQQRPDVDTVTTQRSQKVDTIQWNPLTMDPNTPGLFLKEQARADGTQTTVKAPTPTFSQSFPGTGEIGGAGGFDPNSSSSGGHMTQTSSGGATFDPDLVNSQQHLYHPDAAISSFITQTGSNPGNINEQAAKYDADETNKDYMTQIVDGLFHSPPGVAASAQQAVYGEKSTGYRFSAYQSVPVGVFDASALNQALVASQQGVQGPQNAQSSLMTGSNLGQVDNPTPYVQLPTLPPTGVNNSPIKPSSRKLTEAPKTTELPIERRTTAMHTTATQGAERFDFIPGNLFPGQGHSMAQQNRVASEAAPPSFLRNLPGVDAFNPNLLNSAQNVFNPNAVSWIRTRDLDNIYPDIGQFYAYAQDAASGQPNDTLSSVTTTKALDITLTTPLQTTQDTTTVSSDILTEVNATTTATTATTIGTGTLNVTSPSTVLHHSGTSGNGETWQTDYGTVDGFDPDKVNGNQGQSSFVPGQMVSTGTGYIGGGIMGDRQGGSDQQTDGPQIGYIFKGGGAGAGASVNFNIGALLGMGSRSSNNTSFGAGMAAFNPNMVNNIMAGPVSGKGNSTQDGLVMGFGGASGFDPNAANVGFGSILDSGFGFEHNETSAGFDMGFDPNAANVGFGTSGFDMNTGGTANGNSYMTAFDPNMLNSIATGRQYEASGNATGNDIEAMMGYFLGLTNGNGGGKTQGAYGSAYISSFNPDSVNHASYDPDDFNTGRMHFTPVDMLSTNPSINKDTLLAAGSAFDPDKLNNPNTQLAFTPIDMLSSNPGMDKDTLAHAEYNPAGANKTGISNSQRPNTNQTGQISQSAQPIFDPVDLMAKLMQGSGGFNPGLVGLQKQSFYPMPSAPTNATSQGQTVTSTIASATITPVPQQPSTPRPLQLSSGTTHVSPTANSMSTSTNIAHVTTTATTNSTLH